MVERRAGRLLAPLLALAVVGIAAGCTSESPPSVIPGCPADRITGVLEPLGPPGSMGIAVGNEHLILQWGDGTRTIEVAGTLSAVSPEGTVTARVGDAVTVPGGRIRAGVFFACAPTRVR